MSAYPPEKAGIPGQSTLPTRSTTLSSGAGGYETDEEAITDAAPSNTIGLLLERLQAWKHACGYLENYVTATEKLQKEQSKEYSRVLKSISDPLKEGHHFDQALGGVAGLFENMRANTQVRPQLPHRNALLMLQALANSHLETSKSLDGQVLPILQRLHKEIKNKHSELTSGAGKSAKSVDVAKNNSQKRIELLGQYAAAFDSTGGKIDAHNDPYVLHRGIQHTLHKQVLEENNSRQDLISVQQNFQIFEAHIVQTFQQAFQQFLTYVGGRADREKAMYLDIVSNAQNIAPDFEWNKFQHRQGNMLLDPSAPKRGISHITYPNQHHAATKPLIAGTLERKSRGMGGLTGYKTGFYVVTPAKYLHQFDSEDDIHKDPTPELSLYLPDCTVGAVSDAKFNVKGKDASKGKVGSAFQIAHEINFKAHTAADAQKWRDIIASCATGTNELPDSAVTSPTSPTDARGPGALQTQNLPVDGGLESGGGVGTASAGGAGMTPAGGQTSGVVDSPVMPSKS
ncbi:MAG: hypothetical protein LQ340_002916 [Diploschistes diacapsis]|nr:MAG: hypothetical protein LQ340_002916 [Diploschistes diacapsis]